MKRSTLDALIPVPCQTTRSGQRLNFARLRGFHVDEAFSTLAPEVETLFRFFDLTVRETDAASADFVLRRTALPAEAFRIAVTATGVTVEAGNAAGAFYALAACRQMFFAALTAGVQGAALDCGTVADAPRFPWRGLLLDSARHFQDVETIRHVLRLMAQFRLNRFHWHLTDSQGWRLALAATRGLENHYKLTPGFYTATDIRAVTELAHALHIEVIPEIDIPGHSELILTHHPEYACPNADGNIREFCLGNPEARDFLANVLEEVTALFPASSAIHIGGDEADPRNWEKCPRCQAARQALHCVDMRELEHRFMTDMSRRIAARGRTPIVWGTGSGLFPPGDTVIQCWLDLRDPLRAAPHGNKVIYSLHNSLYFDYPNRLSEPWENWMFELSERGVYLCDPLGIWQEQLKDTILGTEACLWTETVPRWRVVEKILPRLWAYAECAWSAPEKKDWHDFAARKELLEAAGFGSWLERLSR